jgi:hypothetical protein
MPVKYDQETKAKAISLYKAGRCAVTSNCRSHHAAW